MRSTPLSVFSVCVALTGFTITAAVAQETLPAKFANDPVAKAVGAKVFNAALKEGIVQWYGSTVTSDFLKAGGKKRFEERFGIKIEATIGRLREIADRIRTETAVKKLVVDMFDGNDQYMLELHGLDLLEKWRPPAPELANIAKEAFVRDPVGYWWPVYLSAQAIIVNTKKVKPADYPKSYWDIVNPKWKGKVGIRDPRASGGGGWHMLGIYTEPSLGIKYIKELKKVVNPFIVRGGSRKIRDAIATGQFSIGFSGRGEFIQDLPKGTPIKYIVPKEGLAWTPASMALLKNAKHPNTAKVLMTWFYELPQLQLWQDSSRAVPHPGVKPPIPEMGVGAYPLMKQIPSKWLGKPNFFFKEMEQVFGIR